jgi:hypothetical protein
MESLRLYQPPSYKTKEDWGGAKKLKTESQG